MGKIQKIKKLRKNQKTEQFFQKENQQSIWARNILTLVIIGFFAIAIFLSKNQGEGEKTATMQVKIFTSKGEILLELYPDKAPKTVENFTTLAQKGFYNNLIFHRVITDFMIQAGDPFCSDDNESTACGTGGESAWGKPFEDEPNGLPIDTGVLAMANSGPNTNSSQFFIVTGSRQEHLEGKHTVFGKVIEGQNIAEEISLVETDDKDRPKEDVAISRIEITQ